MKLLDDYSKLQAELFDYFGYKEDWCVIPIDDARDYHWYLTDTETCGGVRFAENIEQLKDDEGNYYENEIYTQRHLPKWVYRGDEFTMICVDTNTDGNKFLQIFSNSREVPFETVMEWAVDE